MQKLIFIISILFQVSFSFSQKDTILQTSKPNSGASFIGGEVEMVKFIQTNLRSPKHKGSVTAYIKFTVEKDGRITEPSLMKSSSCDPCDQEAIRVIGSMPNWNPAYYDGENVKMILVLPIKFNPGKYRTKGNVKEDKLQMQYDNALKLYENQNYTEALAEFTALLKSSPYNMGALYKRAEIYLKLNDKEAACRDWHTLQEIDKRLGAELIEKNCH